MASATCFGYILVCTADEKSDLEAWERKVPEAAAEIGLGTSYRIKLFKDIQRKNGQILGLRSRPFGSRLWLQVKPGDCIIFPKFARAFSGLSEFVAHVRRWVVRRIRVVVYDIGLDTSTEFGHSFVAMLAAAVEFGRHRDPAIKDLVTQHKTRKMRVMGRGIFGVTPRGQRHAKYFEVNPTLYELGMKMKEWLADGMTPADIETHLWKNHIYRQFRYQSKAAMSVDLMHDERFARRWSKGSIERLTRNIDTIDQGVLAGTYRLPKTWRPSSGPLKDIPFIAASHDLGKAKNPHRRAVHFDVAKAIGRKVRARRKELGLRQKHLLDLVGVSQSQLSELETGNHVPRSDILAKLAVALQVPVTYFAVEPAVPV